MSFKEIKAEELQFNPFEKLNKQWALVTAGNREKFNTMTVSWGFFGFIWNKPVFTTVIRPTRYTYDFIKNHDYFTVSFFGEEYRDALRFCGAKSGRDYDKPKKTGLTPAFVKDDIPCFEEAELVIVCKKIYNDKIKPEGFVGVNPDELYPDNNYHEAFTGEITAVYKRN